MSLSHTCLQLREQNASCSFPQVISINTGIANRPFLGAFTAVIGYGFFRNQCVTGVRRLIMQEAARYPLAQYGFDEEVLCEVICKLWSSRGSAKRHSVTCEGLRSGKYTWCHFLPAVYESSTFQNIVSATGVNVILHHSMLLLRNE
jgi:hypothetical protein